MNEESEENNVIEIHNSMLGNHSSSKSDGRVD